MAPLTVQYTCREEDFRDGSQISIRYSQHLYNVAPRSNLHNGGLARAIPSVIPTSWSASLLAKGADRAYSGRDTKAYDTHSNEEGYEPLGKRMTGNGAMTIPSGSRCTSRRDDKSRAMSLPPVTENIEGTPSQRSRADSVHSNAKLKERSKSTSRPDTPKSRAHSGSPTDQSFKISRQGQISHTGSIPKTTPKQNIERRSTAASRHSESSRSPSSQYSISTVKSKAGRAQTECELKSVEYRHVPECGDESEDGPFEDNRSGDDDHGTLIYPDDSISCVNGVPGSRPARRDYPGGVGNRRPTLARRSRSAVRTRRKAAALYRGPN